MREYDDETLKKVQQYEMVILRDFIKVCEENHFTYFGCAGTGIGAIRHNGFIPWDDDIDVGILRDDFNKLIEIFKRDYADKYVIANVDNMPNYPLMTTRIMLKGTKFVEEPLKNVKCDLGIFLDVYPFDNCADNKKDFIKQARTTWFWSKILILRFIPFPVLPFKGIKGKIAHAICACAHGVLVLFRISPKWIAKKCLNASTKYNNNPKAKRVGVFFDTNPYTQTVKTAALKNPEYIQFEDVKLPFPSNIDEVLRDMFGDYMQLPPVEKRKNHFPYCLDFGTEDYK